MKITVCNISAGFPTGSEINNVIAALLIFKYIYTLPFYCFMGFIAINITCSKRKSVHISEIGSDIIH